MKSTLFALICSILTPLVSMAQESYIVFDSISGKVFYANLTEEKRPIASLTKVATAKLVLDWASLTKTSLDAQLRVPPSAANVAGANPLNLQAGDILSIRDALYAALLASDNVAAHSLANYVGVFLNQKRNLSGDPMEAFVGEMNRLTKALSMSNTQFENPHGLDGGQTSGLSTATDMAKLSIAAMKDTGLVFMVKQKTRKVTVSKASGESLQFTLKNTNELLGKNGVIGLKTGLTTAAGQCLIAVSDKPPLVSKNADGSKRLRPRQMIIVLLGSTNRFEQSAKLLEAAWGAYNKWGEEGFLVPTDGSGLLKLPTKPAAEPAPQPQPQP